LGRDAWLAETSTGLSLQVGLTGDDGAEFENAVALAGYPVVGYRYSIVEYLSASGFAAGTSNTYNNTDFLTEGAGKAVWIANAATGQTLRVGLTGAGYTKTTGFAVSLVSGITLQGETWGSSNVYDAGDNLDGSAAWVADSSGSTQRVGFWGVGYQKGDGEQQTTITRVTSSGYAGGNSTRFNATSNLGVQAWVQNIRVANGTPTPIGLGLNDGTGGEFARTVIGSSDLYRYHVISFMSDSNYIGGYSERYSGINANGRAAWVHTLGGATVRVGFTGTDYTIASTNFQRSDLVRISDNGIAIGTSQRFSSTGAFRGRAAFVANVPASTIVQAGLNTGEFASSVGTQDNNPAFVSSSGWVVGTAGRYKPTDTTAASNGTGAWVASASTGITFRIGFSVANGAEYAGNGGIESSSVTNLTESGYVAGRSQRYVSGSLSGNAAWVAKASDHSTARLGLFTGLQGSTYLSSTGVQNSVTEYLTESGYAAGYSERYFPTDTSTSNGGLTSWTYHIPSSTFTPITLSINVTNNYSYTRIRALYESGLALGTYELFSPAGLSLGDRAFAWTPAEGYYDLGVDLGATLGIDGWASLDSALYADIYGRIVGYGTRLSNSNPGDSAYLLATIPEPSAALLGLIGAGLCGLSRRRRAA
jgi:hypothetical protein